MDASLEAQHSLDSLAEVGGGAFSSDLPHRNLGGDVVARKRMPARYEGAACSGGGGFRGEKGSCRKL